MYIEPEEGIAINAVFSEVCVMNFETNLFSATVKVFWIGVRISASFKTNDSYLQAY